ncbi:MAG: hypothetical protein GX113_07545 [Actinobacteria bacterium]|nr:hypothetical protein [Actinomycetota bacterium]
MRQRLLTVSLVAICALALLLGMWAIALAQETTTTTTTGNGESTTTSENGDTTTTSEEESTTTTTEIQIVAIPSPVEGAVPTFLSVAQGRLAWTGMVPGQYSTMYLFDIATLANIKIPVASPGPYYNPSSDGPWVVYQGGRAGAYCDIYAYDTGNGLVKRVTNNADPDDGEDWNPRVDNSRIVWEKHVPGNQARSGIYFYDLNGKTAQVPALLLAGDDYHDPDISGDYVVCVKDVAGGEGSEIILYNLKTQVSRSIASGTENNERPRIDKGRVVWSSGDVPVAGWYPWSTYQIKLHDIAGGETTDLTDTKTGNSDPSIDGDTVVWQQREPSGIVVYDLSTEVTQEFAVGGELVEAPDVDGDIVAFIGSKGLYYVRLSTAEFTPFPDVPADHPYLKAIGEMSMNRIIEGYEDGRFGPGDLVTRQQFAKLIVLTMAKWNSTIFTPTFSDRYNFADNVDKSEGELYPYHYVAKAALTGLTRGYSDNTFRPLDNISRQQVISMIVRAGRPVLETPPANWQGSLSYIDPVHGENRRIAEYNGLLDGITALRGSLAYWNVLENATRGEVAQMLYNLLGLLRADLE